MPLHRLKDYYPNYRETLADGQMGDLDSYSIYTQGEDRVGTAKDLLVDDSGRFRYVVVDTGPWIFGKNVLLPIGLANFDYGKNRIYVNGLSKSQVENLPEYNENTVVDNRYEDNVRKQYQPLAQGRSSRQFLGSNYATPNDADRMNALDSDRQRPLESNVRGTGTQASANIYDYDREPHYYGLSDQDNQGPLRLYEERLIAHRSHNKVGEVRVGKQVKTEAAEVTEPITKERVVIERHDVTGQPAAATDHAFENQEVARMDVYEDEVTAEKQAFVREEVNVRKETEQETVRLRDQVRREELDIDTDGNPRVKR
ncbi:photosystem reaction center subunit H [filamentous cyanobacterium CCT1]|nr:photosystem reaction center subunit H [filamentous cyanobacterium CCT1]PSN80074.1 photosystem reaction center subunit H [filamentous cyanobacterium CCP4]